MANSGRAQSGDSTAEGNDVAVTSTLEQVAERLEVQPSALAKMIRIMHEEDRPTEELGMRLHQLATQYNELVAQLHRIMPNDDPTVQSLRNRAADAMERGNFDLANSFLIEARDIDARAVDVPFGTHDERLLSQAETLARLGLLARARLKYLDAAKHFAEASALVPENARPKRWGYLMEETSALFAQGSEFGDNYALLDAVTVCHAALGERSRNNTPLDWASTQQNLARLSTNRPDRRCIDGLSGQRG
jgi:tetratricopeptide (TPR) repeat protein